MMILEQMQDDLGGLLEMFKNTEIGESLKKELNQINKNDYDDVSRIYEKYAPLLESREAPDKE